MINKIKFLIFFLIFILSTSCSFDNKTGIWIEDLEEEKRVVKLEKKQKSKVNVVKFYSSKYI